MSVQKCNSSLNWDDIRYFLTLAESGTVSAAALRLNVNHVTVSRRIDRLEQHLEKVLFDRRLDGYQLTFEGELLLSRFGKVQSTFEQLDQPRKEDALDARVVKISTLPSLADSLVAPALAELKKQYNELHLEIDVSTRNASIAKREVDIAIRFGLPDKGDFLSRRLCNVPYYLVAASSVQTNEKAGQETPVISFGNEFAHLPEAQYLIERYGIGAVTFRSNSATVQLQATISGLGVALLPEYLIRDVHLTRLQQEPTLEREVWLLTRKSASEINSVSLVKKHITEKLQQLYPH